MGRVGLLSAWFGDFVLLLALAIDLNAARTLIGRYSGPDAMVRLSWLFVLMQEVRYTFDVCIQTSNRSIPHDIERKTGQAIKAKRYCSCTHEPRHADGKEKGRPETGRRRARYR